jgi:hypothetical protein
LARSFVKPVPLALLAVALVAVAAGGAILLRRDSTTLSASSAAKFKVALDTSCFDTEEALPHRAPPTGPALVPYLDKALPILRRADKGQHGIAGSASRTPTARRFIADFRDYVHALERLRAALGRNDPAAATAASAAAHGKYDDMVALAEPINSSHCPPQPRIP